MSRGAAAVSPDTGSGAAFNTRRQRSLQAYLQGLARLAAPELPCSPAEQRWIDLLRQELLEFLNPANQDGADSDGEF